ncbi:MAG: O-antigen ligase family protein [Betaproteobacteria bacterium]
MGDKSFIAGPSLPAWALLPASALLALIMLYVLLRTRGSAARFVMFACWFRYMLDVFHQQSLRMSPAGLTWVALGSVGIISVGFVLLEKRRFLIWPFFPVGIICLLMIVSGLINGHGSWAIEPCVRFIYFVVICVAFAKAVEQGGSRFVSRFLWVFLPPICFQLISVALGIVKAGEVDGSASYIGGFYHEQSFSLILATCFLAACFATQLPRAIKAGLILYCLVGIWIANYRTTILGITPLAVLQFGREFPRAFLQGQRTLVVAAMGLVVAIMLTITTAGGGAARFADVANVFKTDLIKNPASFTREDRRVLSGRLYIWSNYIYAYDEAKPLQKIIGLGPDSWSTRFNVYAHNTLVSYLYELGLLGLISILLLWGTMFSLALRAERSWRTRIVAGHVSFFILNMATMPHWQIEGNILYGVLCGFTLAKVREVRRVAKTRTEAVYRLDRRAPAQAYVPHRRMSRVG